MVFSKEPLSEAQDARLTIATHPLNSFGPYHCRFEPTLYHFLQFFVICLKLSAKGVQNLSLTVEPTVTSAVCKKVAYASIWLRIPEEKKSGRRTASVGQEDDGNFSVFLNHLPTRRLSSCIHIEEDGH